LSSSNPEPHADGDTQLNLLADNAESGIVSEQTGDLDITDNRTWIEHDNIRFRHF